MEQQYVEHLIKLSNNIAKREKEYLVARNNLEMLKASYILKNDWELTLGKSKVTQKEKDAYVQVELEEKINEVNDLKLQVEYCKRIYEINVMSHKY